MRSTLKGYRPRLEILEERWVPATVRDVAGDLLISNQSGPLIVTVSTTVAGQVAVHDNGGTITYSGVGSLIDITGTNLGDSITFSGNPTNYAGNLLINSGNGADSITLNGGVSDPTITNGNVTVLTGLGNDSLSLSGSIGGSLTYDSTYGNDTVTIATGGVTVGGSASLTELQNLTLTGAFTVGGSLNLTNLSAGFPLDVTGAGALTVGSATGSLQSLTVTGGAGSNKFIPTGVVSVTGNASFSFTQSVGNNLFTLPAGSSVGGNLSYNGGNGGDTVTLATGDSIAGNATLNLGNGANALVLNEAWLVAGNMTIVEGNGANAAFSIGGTTLATEALVAGNLSITQGNGNNLGVTVNSPPAGMMIYHGGNGTDTLDLEGPAGSVYDVYLTFGTGTNTLTFDSTNNGITYTGTVIGSGGMNTFSQGSNDTLIDINFINFP
jgi:hypothetical protein